MSDNSTRAVALTVDSQPLAETVLAHAGESALVVVLDMSVPDVERWDEWVTDASVTFLAELREVANTDWRGSILTVVKLSEHDDAWRIGAEQAAFEAVRGIVGTLALERARDGIVANTIVVSPQTTDRDLAEVVDYLTDQRLNGFTTGATLHLEHEPRTARPEPGGNVLITGGAGTIGAATAKAFAKAGYSPVLSDINEDALRRTAEGLGGVRTIVLDVTDPEAITRVAKDEQLQPLAAVVLVHGFQGSAALGDLEPDFVRTSMRINADSVHDFVRQMAEPLAESNGSVVVVSSQAGIKAEPVTAAYCAPKFSVIGLQRGLSAELGRRGVSFNTLCPGPVDTAFLRAYFERFADVDSGTTVDEIIQDRAESMAVGRFARPEEMGEALRFLAALDATGVLLAPTGGETLT